MHNSLFSIYRQILSEPWAIDLHLAYSQLPLVIRMLENHDMANAFFSQLNEKYPSSAEISANIVSSYKQKGFPLAAFPHSIDAEIEKNSTAVIAVSGTLTKNGGWCDYGMNDICAWLEAADQNPNVNGVVLIIDSPGGSVDGTVKLGDMISSMSKPIVSLLDGIAASAAYWFASATDKIFALNNSCTVGSIGVALSFVDIRKKMEAEGYVFHDVVSDLSGAKNETFFELLKGNYSLVKQQTLNPLAQMFIDTVLANRSQAAAHQKKWSDGNTFFAKHAISMGLVDQIGDLSDCIDYIQSQSKLNPNNISNSKPIYMSKTQFPLVVAVLGLANMEKTNEGIFLQEEDLQLLETSLAESNAAATKLQESITAKDSEIATLTEKLTAALSDLGKQTTQAETTQADLVAVTEQKTQMQTSLDQLNAELTKLKDDTAADDSSSSSATSDFAEAKSADSEANTIYANRPY